VSSKGLKSASRAIRPKKVHCFWGGKGKGRAVLLHEKKKGGTLINTNSRRRKSRITQKKKGGIAASAGRGFHFERGKKGGG